MNIIVKTASGRFIVRPDTTWERDNEDFYVPEFIDRLSWTPVLFARISKPGRSVGKEFAERYYDGINYGILLYPEDIMDGSQYAVACASCLDHTSFLSFPIYNKATLGREGNVFDLNCSFEGKARKSIFTYNQADAEMICQAIADATHYIYIRTGDILAIELQERKPLCARRGKEYTQGVHEICQRARIEGSYCENEILGFDIIF